MTSLARSASAAAGTFDANFGLDFFPIPNIFSHEQKDSGILDILNG
jgi:hypothetical protein